MRTTRFAVALGIAIAAATLLVSAALGAITGSLNPAAARPGDWVELTTTTGTCCPDAYAQLARAGPTPIFLERADSSAPGNGCSSQVGDMTWANGVGHARFQVPDVQPGEYWLLTAVQGACWRFGNESGILALAVLPPAEPSSISLTTLVATIAGVAALVGLVTAVRWRRRGSRDTPEH